MTCLTFRLQVITPLFLSGADQQAAELRPPSIRGALRFWFRAMMGGMVGGDWQKVKQLEAQLFGDTNQASGLTIRVNALPLPLEPWNFRERGIVYLGYGLSGSRTTPARVYVNVTQDSPYEFDLLLLYQDRRMQGVIVGTLWLLTQFGGLGARTRRGFGGLEISQHAANLPHDMQGLFALPQEPLGNSLQENLRKVRNLFAEFAGTTNIQEPVDPAFPVISKDHWVCRLLNQSFASWQEAMNWIGEEFRKYREDRARGSHTRTTSRGSFSYYISKDYDEAKKLAIPGQSPSQLRLPIFGLPLQFQFQSVGKTIRVVGEKHERRSSPLHIRIRRFATSYRVCLSCFKSHFLSDQEQLRVEDVGNPQRYAVVPGPTWQALDDFLSQFNGQEVNL